MTKIRLFREGNIWHYRFQIGKVRRQRTTGQTLKGKATEIAEREYKRAMLWAHGTHAVPTLAETMDRWLKTHTATASTSHIKSVETIRRLHLYQLGTVPLDKLDTEAVETAMLAHLEAHAPASVNQWLRVLRLICKWAVRRGLIPLVPWNIRLLKVQKKPRATLPVSVAMQWLAQIDALSIGRPGAATAVRLMFGIGLRESETITARWEWIDWERKTYTPGITKGREALPLPMPAWLVEHLEPLRNTTGLIVKHPSGCPFSPGFTRRIMRSANAACEIDGVTPHRLRGTFATLLSEAGVPVQTIQRMLRHKSFVTTMAYLEERMELAVQAQDVIGHNTGLTPRISKVSGGKMAEHTDPSHAQ